jgi:adenylosuccinate lyase
VAEHVGPDSRYIHWGLTSTDVVDTAQALQLLAVNERILAAIDEFMAVVKARGEEHQRTAMIGRTHGVHAEVTTFGLKLAVWYEEMRRNREHVCRATDIVRVGKISGAGQKGTSAMPHKRNPVKCEQISGLSRLLRGYAVTALENMPLWHERDISRVLSADEIRSVVNPQLQLRSVDAIFQRVLGS